MKSIAIQLSKPMTHNNQLFHHITISKFPSLTQLLIHDHPQKKQPNNFLRLVFTSLTTPTPWNNDIKATRTADIHLKPSRHNFILIIFIMQLFIGIIVLCRARKTLINFLFLYSYSIHPPMNILFYNTHPSLGCYTYVLYLFLHMYRSANGHIFIGII